MKAAEGVRPGAEREPHRSPSERRITKIRGLVLAFIRQVEALEEDRALKPRDQISLQEEVRRFETELIRHALALTGGNQKRAARMLGVKVTTLHEKIKRYKIRPASLRGNDPTDPAGGTQDEQA